MAKYNKYLEEKSKPIIDKAIKIAMRDFYKCARRTNNILYNDVTNMYNTLITEFYKYHTTSYIRNWELFTGTEEGQALYFGGDFRKDNDNRISPRLYIDFSGDRMDAEGAKHQHHSNQQVLDYVMSGIRFIVPGTTKGMMTVDPSTMSFHGTAFHFAGGTIQEAFDKFDRDFPDLSADVFYRMWGGYTKHWRKELKEG